MYVGAKVTGCAWPRVDWVKMKTGKGWRKLEHTLPSAATVERWMSMGGTYSCLKFRPPRSPRPHPEKSSQLPSFVQQQIQRFLILQNLSNNDLTSVSSVVDTASFLVVVAGVVVVVVLSFFFLLFFFFVVSSSTFSVVASFSSASSFRGGDPDGLFKISSINDFFHQKKSNKIQTKPDQLSKED